MLVIVCGGVVGWGGGGGGCCRTVYLEQRTVLSLFNFSSSSFDCAVPRRKEAINEC